MSTDNIISEAIKSNIRQIITNIPNYHIDRLGDPSMHNWHDIVLSGIQSLDSMGSSLTHTLKVLSLLPWVARRTRQIGPLLHLVLWPHNQEAFSPNGQQGRTRHSKWKGTDLNLISLSQRLQKPNRVIIGKSHMA